MLGGTPRMRSEAELERLQPKLKDNPVVLTQTEANTGRSLKDGCSALVANQPIQQNANLATSPRVCGKTSQTLAGNQAQHLTKDVMYLGSSIETSTGAYHSWSMCAQSHHNARVPRHP